MCTATISTLPRQQECFNYARVGVVSVYTNPVKENPKTNGCRGEMETRTTYFYCLRAPAAPAERKNSHYHAVTRWKGPTMLEMNEYYIFCVSHVIFVYMHLSSKPEVCGTSTYIQHAHIRPFSSEPINFH